MTKKKLHEGIIQVELFCTDPDDPNYNSGIEVDTEYINKLGLKLGDRVQYWETDKEFEIVSKIITDKNIKKLALP